MVALRLSIHEVKSVENLCSAPKAQPIAAQGNALGPKSGIVIALKGQPKAAMGSRLQRSGTDWLFLTQGVALGFDRSAFQSDL